MDSILEIRNLCVGYESKYDDESLLKKLINPGRITNVLLKNICITVLRNEVLGIVGESGSGKSLTVKSILGLLNFSPGIIQGQIRYKNSELINLLDKNIIKDYSKRPRSFYQLARRKINYSWHVELTDSFKMPDVNYEKPSLQIALYSRHGNTKLLKYPDIHVNSDGFVEIHYDDSYTHAYVSATIEIPWNYNLNSDVEKVIDHYKKQNTFIRGREISMIFQDPKTFLNPHWSIGKQIENVLELYKAGPEVDTKAEQKSMGLPNNVDKALVRDLSGGEIQRVMILLSKITNPKLLIADEPTTGLDVTRKREIVTQVLNQKSNSMIFISHDLHMVRRISDRVNVMLNGEIIENCRSVEFSSQKSLHPYTQKLLSIHESNYSEFLQEEKSADNLEDISGCAFYKFCVKTLRVDGLCNKISPPAIDVESQRIISENKIEIHWIKCWKTGQN
jgi:ABC-type dipeptide/oligopeptide/nickel transport system ATPase component